MSKLPKNGLRKKFPAEGYTPTAAALSSFRTTALAESGYQLLNSTLTCDPAQRATAADALRSRWFHTEPLPTPLSRSEIRTLRRNRDDLTEKHAGTVTTLTYYSKTCNTKQQTKQRHEAWQPVHCHSLLC